AGKDGDGVLRLSPVRPYHQVGAAVAVLPGVAVGEGLVAKKPTVGFSTSEFLADR
ncbi:hypothetical protein JHN46_36140, partial [Streptomyces sp. MBT33]|nr:hypothetical protein [Streptomyces sp. MBT33]